MLKELFFLISLPSIFCVGIYFLPRLSGFKNLGFWEKIVINLAVSVGILTGVLILAGLLPASFRFFSKLIYLLNLFGLILMFLFRKKTILNYFRTLLIEFNKLFSGNLPDLLFISLIAVFIAKILLFLLLKPIVDADVINYYLPFARTFFIENKIPMFNFKGSTPVFFPPIGISALFAYAYSVAGSIFSEAFRLMPLPFILGTVGMVYLLAREFFSRREAQLTTVIFLFLPFWDEWGMAGIFYPDIIFLFLAAVIFYLFLIIFAKGRGSWFLGAMAGMAIGSAMLFKFQAMFFYYFLFILGLSSLPFWRKKINIILVLLAVTPFFIDKSKIGVGYLRQPSFLAAFVLLVFLFLTIFIFLRREQVKGWRNLKLVVFIFLTSLPLTSIWFIRNYFVFGHPFSLITPERIFTWKILDQIIPRVINQPLLTEWTIFLIPSLGSFWLIPKLFFFIKAGREKKWILPLTWIVGWYSIWFFYLDSANIRHLVPIFPLIPLMIFGGVSWFGRRIFGRTRADYFALIAVTLGSLFSLLQSLFLWWNWGVIIYGSESLHRVVGKETLRFNSNPAFSFLISLGHQLLTLLNSQGEIFLAAIPAVAILGIILSALILLIATKAAKSARAPEKLKKAITVTVCLILFLPYVLTFYVISDGNLSQFGRKEQEKVYNYWGLTTQVIPYLKKHVLPEESVVYLGVPEVGLAYFTNLQVYSFLREDLGAFLRPVFYEEDLRKIYLFFREKRIRYFVVGKNRQSQLALDELRKLTKIVEVLEKKEYFEEKIFPDNSHQWAVYEIKK